MQFYSPKCSSADGGWEQGWTFMCVQQNSYRKKRLIYLYLSVNETACVYVSIERMSHY